MRLPLLPALLLCAALAAAGEKVKLESKHGKGDRFVERTSITATLTGKVDDGAGHAGELVITTGERKEILDEVLETAEGRRTKVKRTFTVWERENSRRLAGQPVEGAPDRKESRAMAGKSVTISLDAGKPKVEDAPPEAKELHEGDLRLPPKFELLLPPGEVEAGAAWSLDADALKQFFAGRAVESARISCVFEGIIDFKGARAAKIMTEVEFVEPPEPGKRARQTMKMKGPVFWDPDGARFLQASFSGEATAEIEGLGTLAGPVETEISLEKPE